MKELCNNCHYNARWCNCTSLQHWRQQKYSRYAILVSCVVWNSDFDVIVPLFCPNSYLSRALKIYFIKRDTKTTINLGRVSQVSNKLKMIVFSLLQVTFNESTDFCQLKHHPNNLVLQWIAKNSEVGRSAPLMIPISRSYTIFKRTLTLK